VIARVESTPQSNKVGVLPCNWLAVRIYRACQWTLLMGYGAAMWQGISQSELRSALLVHRVPRQSWEDVSDRVACLVAAARPLLNAKR
jgi:hypothetical protein